MISQDLLEILRCPACVSGETRRPGDDPGQLKLVNSTWLVCQEPGCNRKYPIKDDIPVMLIEEGDKYVNTRLDQLGEISFEVEAPAAPPVPTRSLPATSSEIFNQPQVWVAASLVAFLLTGLVVWLLLKRREAQA